MTTQETKNYLISYGFASQQYSESTQYYNAKGTSVFSANHDKIVAFIEQVKSAKLELASDIAKSVLKFKRLSEKQAYVLALASETLNVTF